MPKKPQTPPRKPKPLYRQKLSSPKGRARCPSEPRRDRDIAPYHEISPSHFTLREDGTIQLHPQMTQTHADSKERNPGESMPSLSEKKESAQIGEICGPTLVFKSEAPFIRLYHGNSLELLDAIYAKYGDDGRFDCIFADPPYFLSNGGITCHAGKMVKVDKGDWDVSRGPALNHEFNTEWLRRCQRVLKPNGTLWVTGTHHVIFSIGYALQQLGYKILNDIAWEKPNPPPNLSCRYFTHSTETILWAARNEKSKHTFNYQEMRKVTGKQMKTVWRRGEFATETPSTQSEAVNISATESQRHGEEGRDAPPGRPRTAGPAVPTSEKENLRVSASPRLDNVWTLSAPGADEKTFGKHPTQKPVALVERCLRAATNEGDLVLDPFLGNGTTAVAAIRLKRGVVGIELDLHNVKIAAKRADREIIEIWLRHFRVRIDISVVGRAGTPLPAARPNAKDRRARSDAPYQQIDLAIFSDSINGSRDMPGVPEIQTERIFHECKFVFLSCAHVERGAVVHTTVDVSLQEAWAKTPTGKKRETTHIVRCETEIFRVKSQADR